VQWYLVVLTTIEGSAHIQYEVDGVEARDKFDADQIAIKRNSKMVSNTNCSLRTMCCVTKVEERRAKRMNKDHAANHGNLRAGLAWTPDDWTVADFIKFMEQPPFKGHL